MRLGTPVRRALAAALDDALVAAPLAGVAAANAVAARRGRPFPVSFGRHVRVLVPLLVTVPAALALGVADARGGAPGKRVLGLATVPVGDGTLPPGASVLRQLVTTTLPWELAHQGLWDARDGRRTRATVLVGASYALLAVLGVQAVTGEGRTLADRLTGTRVVEVAPGAR